MDSVRLSYPSYIKIVLLIFAICYSLQTTAQEQKGDTSAYISLLSGPDVQNNLNFALIGASAAGDTVEIWWLLRYGAEIECITYEKVTPLIYAIANNKSEAARMLIDYGANVNAKTNQLETPLQVAVENNNSDLAEMLIRDSAEVNTTDRFGATPLHYACLDGYFSMADMLLYYDADISKKSSDGTTPLMAAVYSGYADIADLLLQSGAGSEDKDNSGFTPFLIAAQNADTLIMDLLLKHGVNLYEVNKFNYNALDICIKTNSTEAIKYLFRKGDKWGEKSKKTISPYSVAAIYGRTGLIPLLKENKISDYSTRGFDQVSISATIKNCFYDYYTGFSASVKEPVHNIGILVGFDFKPGYTRVLSKVNENLLYQYYNKGAVAYAGLFKDFRLTDHPYGGNWSATGSLSAGYSFGNKLKGTEIVPGNKFRFMPSAGMKWNKGAIVIEADLEYMKTDFYKIGPIWLKFGFSWSVFLDNARSPGKIIKWY